MKIISSKGIVSIGCASLAILSHNALAANPAGVGPEAARSSLRGFSVAEGLEVSLFASEPMVRNPADMDVDARGRVWITEGVNYRSSFQKWGVLQPQGDRIVILEDANGDGVADKETVFYQDPSINTALGVCVLGKDRKSTRLNSSHSQISYAVFCLKKKKKPRLTLNLAPHATSESIPP